MLPESRKNRATYDTYDTYYTYDAQRHNQRRAREVVPKKLKPTFARPLHLKL